MKAPKDLLAIIVAVCLGALILLWSSLYPGKLLDYLFLGIIFAPIIVVVGIVAVPWYILSLLKRHDQGRLARVPVWEMLATFVLVVVVLILISYSIPRQAAFLASRSAFEQAAKTVPAGRDRPVSIKTRLGFYYVDECGIDPRGGVYFRIYAGADGLGPDIISYGVVKGPNSRGTPFGAAGYGLIHIVDDWYWFSASNDW